MKKGLFGINTILILVAFVLGVLVGVFGITKVFSFGQNTVDLITGDAVNEISVPDNQEINEITVPSDDPDVEVINETNDSLEDV